MSALLDEVLEAHGGLERWRAARAIRARVRSGGLLIRTRVPGNRFADYHVTVDVDEPRAVLEPFPEDGQRGVFERGRVRIETDAGDVVASRDDPRPAFFGRAGLRRNLRWDALDSTYFAGYALWNYLTTPLLLTRDGVQVSEGEPGRRRGRAGGVSRPASPRASTRTRAARASTSTRRAVCAATTTSPRWSGDGPGRRTTAPSTRRRAGSCSRPAAGSARSARATGRCPSRPWSGSRSRELQVEGEEVR